EPPLIEASLLIVEADKLGVKDEGLADLTVLVDGFLQLIRTTAEQRAAAQAAAAAPVVPTIPVPAPTAPPPPPSPASARAAAPLTARAASPQKAGVALAAADRVFTIEDKDVVPPMPVEQPMATLPTDIAQIVKRSRVEGIIDVVIDETGRVVDVTLRQ